MNDEPQAKWSISEDRGKEKPFLVTAGDEKTCYKNKKNAVNKIMKATGFNRTAVLSEVNNQLGAKQRARRGDVTQDVLCLVRELSAKQESLEQGLKAIEERQRERVRYRRTYYDTRNTTRTQRLRVSAEPSR